MKNKIIFVLAILIFASYSSSATYAILGNPTSGPVRQGIRQNIDEFRASIAAEIKTKREEFKLRLRELKDAKKQKILTRIDEKIAQINKNQTSAMLKRLERMAAILDRIEDPAGSAARTAILEARAAVEAQSAKDYTITITSEAALKINAGQTVSQLQADLKAVREKVEAAKQKVVKAVQVWQSLKLTETASPSAIIQN